MEMAPLDSTNPENPAGTETLLSGRESTAFWPVPRDTVRVTVLLPAGAASQFTEIMARASDTPFEFRVPVDGDTVTYEALEVMLYVKEPLARV